MPFKDLEKYKDWRKKNRLHSNKWSKEYEQKCRKECEELIGNRCIICGSLNSICFHEIHGKKHPRHGCSIRHHSQDFIPICKRHHIALHLLIEAQKLGVFDKVLELLKKTMPHNPTSLDD